MSLSPCKAALLSLVTAVKAVFSLSCYTLGFSCVPDVLAVLAGAFRDRAGSHCEASWAIAGVVEVTATCIGVTAARILVTIAGVGVTAADVGVTTAAIGVTPARVGVTPAGGGVTQQTRKTGSAPVGAGVASEPAGKQCNIRFAFQDEYGEPYK